MFASQRVELILVNVMEICSKPLGDGYVSRGIPGMLVHVYCVVVTEITNN